MIYINKNTTKYLTNNKAHRVGLWSIKWFDGLKQWTFNDKYHKVNGPGWLSYSLLYKRYQLYNNHININVGRIVI